MKIVSTFLLCISLHGVFYSQSAVVSAGGSATSAGGSVSYTVGQIAYESYGNSNFQITEGVQQVFIINILGCTSSEACNFNDQANLDNGSCLFIGDACDDDNAGTTGDSISADCTCMGVMISVEMTETTGIRLYPNPTSQNLMVQSDGEQSIQKIEILDMNGKRVLSEAPLSSSVNLNVASLAAGQYFVEVKTHNHSKRVQIQIIR